MLELQCLYIWKAVCIGELKFSWSLKFSLLVSKVLILRNYSSNFFYQRIIKCILLLPAEQINPFFEPPVEKIVCKTGKIFILLMWFFPEQNEGNKLLNHRINFILKCSILWYLKYLRFLIHDFKFLNLQSDNNC